MKRNMKKYEIWIGYYDLGQGYGASDKPKMVGEIWATSFKIACCIYEHQSQIESLKERMLRR
jgi:mannose-6-phosphate isomerase class I